MNDVLPQRVPHRVDYGDRRAELLPGELLDRFRRALEQWPAEPGPARRDDTPAR